MITVGEELPSLPPLTARHVFFIIQTFEQLSCPEKHLPWNLSLCWNIFYLSGLLRSLCLSWKNSVPWIHCIEYIFSIIQNFGQLALALKNRVCPEIFHRIEIFFIFQDFWATFACPEKLSVPWIRCIEYVIFIIQNFEQFALALKNRVALKFFTVLNVVYTFRIFEQLVFALKNRVCPETTVLNICFSSFRILNNLRLPWKTEFALRFFTVLKYCLSFRIFEQLELALKTEFALKFSSRGRAASRLVRHWVLQS